MATVHIFINANGVFIQKTLDYVETIDPGKHFYFVQRGSQTLIPKNQLLASKIELEVFIAQGKIDQVLFHSLHYYQFRWMRHLRKSYPSLRLSWMFWSFEYYQLSFQIIHMYGAFSRQFLTRKLIFNVWENMLSFFKGESITLLPISKKKYAQSIGVIDQFCSFNQVDFVRIFGQNNRVSYLFMPYLDVNDLFVQMDEVVKSRIMVGHNGSPLLNHVEVIDYLSKKESKQEIILPLNYGKAEYIRTLKNELKNYPSLNLKTLDHALSMADYYAYVADVEYFLLNSYCQQGLGNIIYFLFNNSTVYLSEKSSSFQFFSELGFSFGSMEELVAGGELTPISLSEKARNKALVHTHFNREKVEQQWREMLIA